MIYKKCIMTINKNNATLDEDIYLFRLDKNIELHFTIVNNKYKFDKSDLNNIIAQTNAAYFQIRLYRSDEIKYTFTIQPTQDGVAVLTITDDLIDDPIELGEYDFQISLLDADKTSMISMPIVSQQLHVCEPLVDNQAIMGKAVLGLSKAAKGEIKNAFDSQGNYIREIHNDGEIISAQLFNKFEEALETNTKAIKNGTGGTGTSYDDTAIKADIKTLKDSQINLVEDETSMEGIKDNEYPTLTTTDKTIIGGINEVNTQYKDIANKKIDNVALSNNVLTFFANSKTIKAITLPASTTEPGTNAKEIELQKSTTHIQWRYVGDTEWTNLVALADLKGSKGDKGEQGIQGVKGDKGDTGSTPNLQIGEITTLDSGSSATASITGTVENPLLNLGIPKGVKGDKGDTGASSGSTLVTINTSGTTLVLTTDKYQTATVVDGTEITLPTVTTFTEIHLFFSTTTDLTLVLPACKWQNGNTPTILANKTYEFIFTYTTEWLGGVIVYE